VLEAVIQKFFGFEDQEYSEEHPVGTLPSSVYNTLLEGGSFVPVA